MTKKNPDDSVREEQFGANENAAGTEDATAAQEIQENDSVSDSSGSVNNHEDVIEKNGKILEKASPDLTKDEKHKSKNDHSSDRIRSLRYFIV